MADDRTPRTISLTGHPPDEDTPRTRKRPDTADAQRKIRVDAEAIAAGERDAHERAVEERPSSRLV